MTLSNKKILLKDFNKEFGHNNTEHKIEESRIEDIDTNFKEDDVPTMKIISDDNDSEPEEFSDDINFQTKGRNKKRGMKIKFPMMGKINIKKHSNEKKSETKLEHHTIPCSERISSRQGDLELEEFPLDDVNSRKINENAPCSEEISSSREESTLKINDNTSKKSSNGGRSRERPVYFDKESCMKPLMNGWQRELVLRNTYTGKHRAGDIYYYTPTKKKLRSRVEIGRFLQEKGITEFTVENFTFAKSLVGAGEPHETERNAFTRLHESCPLKNKSSKPVKSSSKPSINLSVEDRVSSSLSEVLERKQLIPRASSKRKIALLPEDDSQLHEFITKKRMKVPKLRDRRSIHPPSRFKPVKENGVNRKSNSNEKTARVNGKRYNPPEEMVIEPDIYFDHDSDDENFSTSLRQTDDNLYLNFPFGIDESDNTCTFAATTSKTTTTKESIYSNKNLPPIATHREKDGSKPDFPLIQFNLEDLLCEEDGGVGGEEEDPEEENSNDGSSNSKTNPSKIRVKSLDELCDSTSVVKPSEVATQPTINPVIMNFHINGNLQTYLPPCNAGVSSIPSVPVTNHISYNNIEQVPLLVSLSNYVKNNPAVAKNKYIQVLIPANSNGGNIIPLIPTNSNGGNIMPLIPANSNGGNIMPLIPANSNGGNIMPLIPANSNGRNIMPLIPANFNERLMPLQDRVSNVLRVMAPVNIAPNPISGNTNFNKFATNSERTLSSGQQGRLGDRCKTQSEFFELVRGNNNKMLRTYQGVKTSNS